MGHGITANGSRRLRRSWRELWTWMKKRFGLLLAAPCSMKSASLRFPETILRRPAVLTAEERLIMREYCLRGYEIVRKEASLQDGAEIVRSHRERFDGTGYPQVSRVKPFLWVCALSPWRRRLKCSSVIVPTAGRAHSRSRQQRSNTGPAGCSIRGLSTCS
jgi:hypothetical protein